MKRRSASFYIMIVLALLAVGALVFLLAPGRQITTPAVVLPTLPPADATAPVAPERASDAEIIAITPETVQTVIGTLRRVDSYSRILDIQDYWTGGSRSRTVAVWSKGSRLRLRILSDGQPEQELLLSDGEKWLWYADSAAVFHGDVLPGDGDRWQTLMTYEDLLSAPPEDILDAGYAVYSGINCVFVRWRSGALGFVSECYIDPDTGLLMGERSYDGDLLTYSMDSSVPDVTTPDESVFQHP